MLTCSARCPANTKSYIVGYIPEIKDKFQNFEVFYRCRLRNFLLSNSLKTV